MADDAELDFPIVELPPLASSQAVVEYLVQRLVDLGKVPSAQASRIVCQVMHRESLGSAAIGKGVALPHSKSDAIKDMVGIIGKSTDGVSWQGALDAEPVRVVCLFVYSTDRPKEALRGLEAIARRFRRNMDDGGEGPGPSRKR